MAYWLLKSEPNVWSWLDQTKRGRKGEPWTGIRNYEARNYMKKMQIKDRAFFYHSNIGKEIIGIVEISSSFYLDPTSQSHKWVCVDVYAIAELLRPVTLKEIKMNKKLEKMDLVRRTRLSVQPVLTHEWNEVLKIAGGEKKIIQNDL